MFGSHADPSLLADVMTLDNGPIMTAAQVFFLINCIMVMFIIFNPVFLDLEEQFKIPKRMKSFFLSLNYLKIAMFCRFQLETMRNSTLSGACRHTGW